MPGSRQASVQVFSLLRAILVSGLGKHLNFDLDFPVCRNVEKSTSFDLRKKKKAHPQWSLVQSIACKVYNQSTSFSPSVRQRDSAK